MKAFTIPRSPAKNLIQVRLWVLLWKLKFDAGLLGLHHPQMVPLMKTEQYMAWQNHLCAYQVNDSDRT